MHHSILYPINLTFDLFVFVVGLHFAITNSILVDKNNYIVLHGSLKTLF
jgi:hypothetical protein